MLHPDAQSLVKFLKGGFGSLPEEEAEAEKSERRGEAADSR